MTDIRIPMPDDWHVHLRDEQMLPLTLGHARRQFGRVLAMPNLVPPLTTMALIGDYQRKIARHLGPSVLYSLYLTETTQIDDIEAASADDRVIAVKWYPAGATTNSASGVTDIEACLAILERMEETGLVLSIHGEVTDNQVDIFDREAVFIERLLEPLRHKFPRLRIVLEHISSAASVNYVASADSDCLAATITAHHLLIDRNDLLVGGIKPHLYCLPIVKTSADREALVGAATSGKPCFFLGTDSAPHGKNIKESSCGCAGCYTAGHALELYAWAFESVDQLERLENFASVYGCRYYGFEPSDKTIRLVREPVTVPLSYRCDTTDIIPLFAGEELPWRVVYDAPCST